MTFSTFLKLYFLSSVAFVAFSCSASNPDIEKCKKDDIDSCKISAKRLSDLKNPTNQDIADFEISLNKLCDKGIVQACNDAGTVYSKLKQVDKATSYYKKACLNNYELSCINLARLNFESGKTDLAIKAASELCPKNENACVLMAEINYSKGDFNSAVAYYDKACSKKDYSSCWNAAHIIGTKGGNQLDMYHYLFVACSDGNHEKACNVLKKLNANKK